MSDFPSFPGRFRLVEIGCDKVTRECHASSCDALLAEIRKHLRSGDVVFDRYGDIYAGGRHVGTFEQLERA